MYSGVVVCCIENRVDGECGRLVGDQVHTPITVEDG